MSAALNALPDISVGSSSNQPELSLGSLLSTGLSTPAQVTIGLGRRSGRVASDATSTTAPSLANAYRFAPSPSQRYAPNTPAPPSAVPRSANSARRKGTITQETPGKRRGGDEDEDDDDDGDDDDDDDAMDTPGPNKGRYAGGISILGTPGAALIAAAAAGAANGAAGAESKTSGKEKKAGKGGKLTLRDQEKHIDNLKKENFNIKLRVHFLEERLARLAPDELESVIKQNINLKIEVQEYRVEFKKQKKLMLELERELARLQQQQQQGNSKEKELEAILEEKEREGKELRKRLANRSVVVANNANDEDAYREIEARNAELEDELDDAQRLLGEHTDEVKRLKDIIDGKGLDDSLVSSSSISTTSGESNAQKLKRRLAELENDNEALRARLGQHEEALAQKEDEAEDLIDENEGLRLHIEGLQRRRELEGVERSESRAHVLEEREGREAMEDELHAVKDRLAATQIELQQTSEDVFAKEEEIRLLVEEHRRVVGILEDEWRGEVEDAKRMVEDLRDVLAERDSETKDLRLQVSELEAGISDLTSKFETTLAHLEEQSNAKDNELENMNTKLRQMEDHLDMLEDENDKLKVGGDQTKEEDGVEKEKLEGMLAILREKYATAKSQLEQITQLYDECTSQINQHRTREEELSRRIEDLLHTLEKERALRSQLEDSAEADKQAHASTLSRQQRLTEDKECALQVALSDLNRARDMVAQREQDLAKLRSVMETTEKESKKMGEQAGSAKFGLQLETERLKRDLERAEDELQRARKELEDKERNGRLRNGLIDKLNTENRDLSAKLAAQNQARMDLMVKLDGAMSSAKKAERELAGCRSKVSELEARLAKEQRSGVDAEGAYKDQLTERNTLLLTIYQYLDKILGVDKTPKKPSHPDTKPFANFSLFHDNLITRLKELSHIRLDFDRRCKDVESKFTEQLNEMRRQLERRWRQVDRFETSVKAYAETKLQWKKRLMQKDGEVEALKATNAELTTQLRRSGANNADPSPQPITTTTKNNDDSSERRALLARALGAERRLQNAQGQLAATESLIDAINGKTGEANAKWEARVREYENLLKRAEERYKKERQGSKEAVRDMDGTIKILERQLEIARKRNERLSDMVEQLH